MTSRSRLTSSLKRIVAGLLFASGILSLIAAVRFRDAIVVLMYHRVLPRDADTCSTPAICVTPETFERQLRLLKRSFNILSLQNVVAVLSGAMPMPKRACLITFDDGWEDNFLHAYPILQRVGVPATIFVSTDFIGSSACFWQERLTRLLLLAREHRCLASAGIDEAHAQRIYAISGEAARREIADVVRRLKQRPRGDIEALIRDASDRLAAQGVDAAHRGDDRFMNWEQLRTLCDTDRIEIGSHLCSHVPIPFLPAKRVRDELIESKQKITAETGRAVRAVAYPNGDYTPRALALARETGYSLGFSVESGRLHRGDDPFRVRRINISESGTDTPAGFMTRLVGLF